MGEATFDRKKVLGKGAFAIVFAGKFKDQDVAVKRIQNEDVVALSSVEMNREISLMKEMDHPNVVKLLHVVQDENFKYIYMELCAATVDDYCEKKYNGPMPPDIDSLQQMAKGLHHIHSKCFVHRDIKAANVLISAPINTSPSSVLLKISDFGFSKPSSSRGSFSMSQGTKGTVNFTAPELLIQMEDDDDNTIIRRGSVKCDIFSLGCLFFALLTRGGHPFSNGSIHTITANIHEGHYFLHQLGDDHYAKSMIEQMIQNDPERRPELGSIITYFEQM